VAVRVLDGNGSPIPRVVVRFLGRGELVPINPADTVWNSDYVYTDVNGRAAMQYTFPTKVESTTYTIGVTALMIAEDGQWPGASWSLNVLPGAPAQLTLGLGNDQSGTIGQPLGAPLSVVVEDQFGNPVGGAAGQIAVSVSGANPVSSVPVEEQSGGHYRAGYTPTAAGFDQIDVRVGGAVAPGSPFTSPVSAGPPDARGTVALVPDGRFGDPIEISVILGDAQGNRIGADAGVVAVTVRGVTALTVEYAGDGIYRARWVPFLIGIFQVDITLNGTPIANSPYTTQVRFF
jgi:hypothetical protein